MPFYWVRLFITSKIRSKPPARLLPLPPPPPPLPHPTLQIPPYLHIPLQWIHPHLLQSMLTKSQPALSPPLHHPVHLLLLCCPTPMTKPELASTSTLCLTSHLFLLNTPSTKSLPALRPMPSSTSRSNASNSSIVGAQSSKRPWLSSQHSDAVVDLLNKCSTWNPHQRLLLSNVIDIMDFSGDRNCLFQACISKL
jgi:hypothetical protein